MNEQRLAERRVRSDAVTAHLDRHFAYRLRRPTARADEAPAEGLVEQPLQPQPGSAAVGHGELRGVRP